MKLTIFDLFKTISLTFLLTAVVAKDCLEDPTDSSCTDYTLDPETVEKDISNLCRQMFFMPGCSVSGMCQNTTSVTSEPYCNRFSILADICATDMPGMSDCKNYNKMCAKGSVVNQCKNNAPIANLPTTTQTDKLIHSICDEMTMDGCEKCPKSSYVSKCDLLGTYAQLCQAMPEMNQCAEWSSMCPGSAAGSPKSNLPYCAMNSGDTPPQMRMYFHTGLADYILFKEWVPRTAGQYAGSFIAIIAIGILYEFLLTMRTKFETGWTLESNDKLTSYSFRQFQIDGMRAVLQFVESGIAYLLMLISMTFNVGLFFAVILGITFGTFTFARFRTYGSTKRPCGC